MDSVAFSLCESLSSGRTFTELFNKVPIIMDSIAFAYEQDGYQMFGGNRVQGTPSEVCIYRYIKATNQYEKLLEFQKSYTKYICFYKVSNNFVGFYIFFGLNSVSMQTGTIDLANKSYTFTSAEVSVPLENDSDIYKLGEFSNRHYFIAQSRTGSKRSTVFSVAKGSTDFRLTTLNPNYAIPTTIMIASNGYYFYCINSSDNQYVSVTRINFVTGSNETLFQVTLPFSVSKNLYLRASRVFGNGRGFGFIGTRFKPDNKLFKIDIVKKTFEIDSQAYYYTDNTFDYSEILDNKKESVMTNGLIYYNNYPNEIEGLDTLKSWIASR